MKGGGLNTLTTSRCQTRSRSSLIELLVHSNKIARDDGDSFNHVWRTSLLDEEEEKHKEELSLEFQTKSIYFSSSENQTPNNQFAKEQSKNFISKATNDQRGLSKSLENTESEFLLHQNSFQRSNAEVTIKIEEEGDDQADYVSKNDKNSSIAKISSDAKEENYEANNYTLERITEEVSFLKMCKSG